MAYFVDQFINGLTLGAVYGLIAIGYTMVYGIIGMINFAHGEVYMIGAVLTIIVFTLLGMIGLTWVPLALMAGRIRTMRIYDGPSEVHRMVVARNLMDTRP